MMALVVAACVACSPLDSLLERASFNRPVWERVVGRLIGVEHERAIWLLGSLQPLDLMEADEATILSHIQGCTTALARHPTQALSEDTLRAFILNPRTGYFDMMTDWRGELWPVFRDGCTGDFAHDVQMVFSLLRDRVAVETRTDAFGPPSPPGGTFRRGWGSEEEWASLAVASLRTVGIAARLCHEGKGVQAWDGKRWQSVHEPPAGPSNTSPPGALARMELLFTADGQLWRNTEQLGLSRWSKGAWRPVEPPVHPVSADLTDTSILVNAPPGDYLVTAGIRNANGEPRVWCRAVALRQDSLLTLSADLSIPFAELKRRDLVESPEPTLGSVVLRDSLGAEVKLVGLISRPTLVVAVESGSELSERLMVAAKTREEELEAGGVRTIVVAHRGARGAAPWTDSDGSLWAALGLESEGAPAVVVVSARGEIMLFKRRAGPHTLELALASLRAARPDRGGR